MAPTDTYKLDQMDSKLQDEAAKRHVSMCDQEDGQNSTVASARKKKVTQGGEIQEPGSGTSKNGDDLTQRRSHVSNRDQEDGQNSTVASHPKKKVTQVGAIQESNHEIGRLRRDPLDIRPFPYTVEKHKLNESTPVNVFSTEVVAPTSGTSTYSENSHPVKIFWYILNTKPIHHNSSHPRLVYGAKALLGIVMFVVFAQDVLLFRYRC